MALSIDTQDPKTVLNTFCQKYTRKPISKADIVYSSVQFGELYQVTVTLHCLGGVEFAGETASSVKEAEKNAARQAIQNYAAEIAALPPTSSSNNKKRKASTALSGDGTTGAAVPMNLEELSAKGQLNNMLMRILRKALSKEDVLYNTVQTALGYQCTISMPCLPDEWSRMAWAGEVAENKKVAEVNAAKYAVQALMEDAQMSALVNAGPPAKAAKVASSAGGGGGGGAITPWIKPITGKGGGGKGGSFSEFFTWFAGAWQGGGGWGGNGKSKGKGKGKGKGWQNPGPRERVTSEPVTGNITEWKGKYGWVQLHSNIDHEKAARHGGRTFLHKADWQDATKEPAEGMVIQCQIYADNSGLGCEEVTPL